MNRNLSNGGTVTSGTGREKTEAEWFVSEFKKALGI
jgi:hypothetical protein